MVLKTRITPLILSTFPTGGVPQTVDLLLDVEAATSKTGSGFAPAGLEDKS
jgi:hypothetical protein